MSLLGDGNPVEVAHSYHPQANAIPGPSLGPALLQAVAQDHPPNCVNVLGPPSRHVREVVKKTFEVVTTASYRLFGVKA